MITIQQLLKAVVKQNASDLHLIAGSPPILRVNGRVVRVKTEELSGEDTRKLCYSIITDVQKSKFEEQKELDFSFGIKNMARFRANFFFQKGFVSGVFRRVALEIPSVSSLGLPQAAIDVTNFNAGLVLVTGPTGSGKSTTIASLLDKINQERRGHIITLEDPIEYIHQHKNCIINQREVGSDTEDFLIALKSLLRQDPDVCLIGELRDNETVEATMKVAETGHLVFGTLHTNTAIQSISRIVGMFPSEQRERARMQLSEVLNAVITQKLLPSRDGGMVAACELMILTPNIRHLIRENKLHQAYGLMQVGQEKTGMVTMNQSLLKLIMNRKINVKVAFSATPDPEELDQLMEKAGL
ncbi:MAG: type IV pilus twitching motility protein PilT [Bdellovibrionales bacterium]|nr:type IV pilus twitching motility protein PilT [Bdellovibrionales bacterium]